MVTVAGQGDNPKYIPFISRWNDPLILTIDPNFQRDIQVGSLSRVNAVFFFNVVDGDMGDLRQERGWLMVGSCGNHSMIVSLGGSMLEFVALGRSQFVM